MISRFSFVLLCLSLAVTLSPVGASSMGSMASGFLEMMDSMAEAYARYRGNNRSGYSWQEDFPGQATNGWDTFPSVGDKGMGMAPGMPMMNGYGFPSLFPYLPNQLDHNGIAQPTLIDGWWLGQSGEVLAFRHNRFRIYIGPAEYREGNFQVRDWQLTMTDPNSGTERLYEFALMDRYLALRDDRGDILYYISVDG